MPLSKPATPLAHEAFDLLMCPGAETGPRRKARNSDSIRNYLGSPGRAAALLSVSGFV